MEQFRNIGIIGRLGSSQVLETVRRLKKFLMLRHLHVILEDTIAEVLPGHGLQTSSRKMLGEVCDMVIVVGGDGSLLGAARALARHNVPVLGINRGSLGFLTDIRPDELEVKVAEVLDGHYLVENRFLLQAEVRRHAEAIGQGDTFFGLRAPAGKWITGVNISHNHPTATRMYFDDVAFRTAVVAPFRAEKLPAVDVAGESNGGAYVVSDGASSINVRDISGTKRRMVMEFNVSDIGSP